MTYVPFLISLLTGICLLHLLFRKHEDIDLSLKIILGAGLGLGLNASITFLSFILLDRFHQLFVIGMNLGLCIALVSICGFLFLKDRPTGLPITFQGLWPYLLIGLAAVPLWYQANFFVYGGWDAWETWNLKAKFLLLGGHQWDNMFNPILWRSSPHYPLLLPLINVWGWSFIKDPAYQVPLLTSFTLTMLTVCLLYSGLKQFTRSPFVILPALILLTLPVYNKDAYSQYSDIVLSFYILATLICLILAKTRSSLMFAFCAGLFAGFLSFSKSEGTIAAMILVVLAIAYLFWKDQNGAAKKLIFFLALGAFIAFLPTLIFSLFYAPENITFTNGLFSETRPSTLRRLQIIFGFYFFEAAAPICNMLVAVSLYIKHHFQDLWNILNEKIPFLMGTIYLEPKWHGLWVICSGGLILSRGRCLNRQVLIVPLFLILYSAVFTFYYFVNTYFEIGWWLQVTLHRILFALLPTVLFWTFYSLFEDSSK